MGDVGDGDDNFISAMTNITLVLLPIAKIGTAPMKPSTRWLFEWTGQAYLLTKKKQGCCMLRAVLAHASSLLVV